MSCFWETPVGISSFLILQDENTFSLHFCFIFIKNLSLLSNWFGSILWKMAANRLTLLKRTSLEKLMRLLPLSFSLCLLLMTQVFTDLPFKITEGFIVPWDKFRISYCLLVVMWIYSYSCKEGIYYVFPLPVFSFFFRLVRWNRSCHAKTPSCWPCRQSWRPSQISSPTASSILKFWKSLLQLKSKELPSCRQRWNAQFCTDWLSIEKEIKKPLFIFLLLRLYNPITIWSYLFWAHCIFDCVFDSLGQGTDRKDECLCISAHMFLWMDMHFHKMFH